MKKIILIVLFAGLAGVLAGCGPSAQEKLAQEKLNEMEQIKAHAKEIEGVYFSKEMDTKPNESSVWTFKSDGYVTKQDKHGKIEVPYTVAGNTVSVTMPFGMANFTLLKDGTLSFIDEILTKQKPHEPK